MSLVIENTLYATGSHARPEQVHWRREEAAVDSNEARRVPRSSGRFSGR